MLHGGAVNPSVLHGGAANPSGLHDGAGNPSGLHGGAVNSSGLHGGAVNPSGLHGGTVNPSGLSPEAPDGGDQATPSPGRGSPRSVIRMTPSGPFVPVRPGWDRNRVSPLSSCFNLVPVCVLQIWPACAAAIPCWLPALSASSSADLAALSLLDCRDSPAGDPASSDTLGQLSA